MRIGVVRDADGRDKVVQDKRPKELIGLLGINVTARYSNWNTKDHRAQDPCQVSSWLALVSVDLVHLPHSVGWFPTQHLSLLCV